MSTRSSSKVLVASLLIASAAACSDARDEEPSEVQLAAGPLPRRPGANVKNLPDFLKCMNDNLKKGDSIDKAVACLPAGCTITLVMSESSAQPGCAPPKGAQKCQLPRVLLACGDPKFEPSFTLCPTSSEGGMQRIEVCQAMPGTDDTEMADIAAFANGYDPAVATLKQVLSMPNDDDTGTKGCNGNCHLHEKGKRTDDKNNVVNTGVNGGLLSTRVAPDVNKLIFTTDPAVKAAIEKAKKDGEYAQLEGTKDEDLASICKCIDENKDKEPFTKESGKLALDLCNALLSNVGGAGGGAGGHRVPNERLDRLGDRKAHRSSPGRGVSHSNRSAGSQALEEVAGAARATLTFASARALRSHFDDSATRTAIVDLFDCADVERSQRIRAVRKARVLRHAQLLATLEIVLGRSRTIRGDGELAFSRAQLLGTHPRCFGLLVLSRASRKQRESQHSHRPKLS